MPVNNINKIFLGNEEIVKAYLGSEQIYSDTKLFHAQFDLSKGGSSATLTLPFNTEDSYSDLTIDWGDQTITTGTNTHTYDVVGIYDVKINGEIRSFGYNGAESAQKLIRIINWGGFIIDTDGTFAGCANLESVDLESVPTNEVTNFTFMFRDCSALTSIPLLNTSNVTNVNSMFLGCTALTSIPLLNTSNVTIMQNMFRSCSALTTIPLLNTSNVTDMAGMFMGCPALTTIPDLDTSKVTNMSYMFYVCSVLDVDLSGWCVPLITSLPTNFATNAPLMTEDKRPVWGTCP